MGRRRISRTQEVGFSVRLVTEDRDYLDHVAKELSRSAATDAFRLILASLRTTFSLPAYQSSRVRADMEARGQSILPYLQELIARRYEALVAGDAQTPAVPPSMIQAARPPQALSDVPQPIRGVSAVKPIPSSPPVSQRSLRFFGLFILLVSTAAHAQSMGQGLFTWATPFLALLIGAGIIIGLAMAFVNPQHLAKVVWGLVIAVAIFAILRGMNGLLSAVQQG